MKVKDITDVYQLLKASSLCKEDLIQLNIPTDDGNEVGSTVPDTDFYLVLKKWREIHPGTEFRCFVRDKNLIGRDEFLNQFLKTEIRFDCSNFSEGLATISCSYSNSKEGHYQ